MRSFLPCDEDKVLNFNIILQPISLCKPQLLSLKFPYFHISKNYCFRMKNVQNHHLCLSCCVSYALVGKELSPPWLAASGELAQAKVWVDLQRMGTCPGRATSVASSKLAVPCFGERLVSRFPNNLEGYHHPETQSAAFSEVETTATQWAAHGPLLPEVSACPSCGSCLGNCCEMGAQQFINFYQRKVKTYNLLGD